MAATAAVPVQVGTANGDWIVTDAGSGAGNFGDVTLPYAVNHIPSGDTILFASSLSGDTITVTSTLSIGPNITITGGPGIAVNGGGNGSTYNNTSNAVEVFLVNTGVTASFSSLTIEDGDAGSSGGGIQNNGTLTLELCFLPFLAISSYYGGGINNLGTLTINHGGVFRACPQP